MLRRSTSLAPLLAGALLAQLAPPAGALTATPTATPSGLAHLQVRVAEFPDGCQGTMRGVRVSLQPGGGTQETGLGDGTARFNVAPGSYTLAVLPDCNPFGCWADRGVDLAAGAQFVTLCPLPRAATPTPTPTVTPTPTGVGWLGEKSSLVQVFNLASGAPEPSTCGTTSSRCRSASFPTIYAAATATAMARSPSPNWSRRSASRSATAPALAVRWPIRTAMDASR